MRLLTWNLYLGASLDPVTGARSADELPGRVDEVWADVAASDPPARLRAIARAIRDAAPDAAALQEVARWEGPRTYDFLALLLAELPGYQVAAEVVNFGGALPGAASGVVSLVDRGVLLARDGLEVRDARGARLDAAVRLPAAGGELEVPRGLVSAAVAGVRVVGVHLELAHLPELAAVHEAQAAELAALAVAEPLPLALLGDLNARPGAGAHALLGAAGLADAWAALYPADPGFTCCEARSLRNERSSLFERIDHLLVRGLAPRAAWRVGQAPEGGRWPSDHRGVVVELEG